MISVTGESDRSKICSDAVRVSVASAGGGGDPTASTREVGDACRASLLVHASSPRLHGVGGGGSVRDRLDEVWTAAMGRGGWIRMSDGMRSTCAAAGGCQIVDAAVTTVIVTPSLAMVGG